MEHSQMNNERIRELAEQAGIVFWEISGDVDWRQANRENLNKFAELIVRESIDQLQYCLEELSNSNSSDSIENHYFEKGAKWAYEGAAILIKKHFGVEEKENAVYQHRCSVCGTTENVRYVGGYQPYLCDSEDCIPF